MADLSHEPWLIAQLNAFLRDQHMAERVLAETRQRQIAKDLGENRRSMNGLGRPYLEVDDYAYHAWGQKLGYACWQDKQFLREFWRDNDHCRVKAGGTRLQVGYGSLSSGCRKKFKKSYT